MKPSIEARALAACREQSSANAEVRRLSKAISRALSACFEVWAKGTVSSYDEFAYRPYTSHLEQAYAHEEVENDHWSGTHKEWLSESDKLEILGECQHCMAAHNAIQERKVARRRLGAARRAVTMIGRLI
jgi:Zn finger protein HypA/HybF involved in hydrogenase expression